jgi:GNAT superfamily N-acetyltransferase
MGAGRIRVTREGRDTAYDVHKLAFPDDKWCGDDCEYWVMRRGFHAIGFLAVRIDERGVFISRVAVAKAEGGKGLGRRLVRLALRFGRARGHAHAYTYTLLKNYQSMCMLQACGFRFVEPPPQGQYHGPNIHYFARPL